VWLDDLVSSLLVFGSVLVTQTLCDREKLSVLNRKDVFLITIISPPFPSFRESQKSLATRTPLGTDF
jgi:hypothetical protein